MKRAIYLDNAATTPLRKEVKERMAELLDAPYGNPSSSHQFGRKSRIVVENSRKTVARLMGCTPGEIVFTSGGSEADNMALQLPVRDLGIKRIITSPIEHPAVLNAAELLARNNGTEIAYVGLLSDGHVDMDSLEELLKESKPTLVSLMHGNNEVGNLLDLRRTGELCRKYEALFHSDTVQTVGHFEFDLKNLPIDFISASAHKFNGPKGVGFLYANSSLKLGPLVAGGGQERGMRAGTENVIGIGALETALSCAYENLEEEKTRIKGFKNLLIQKLREIYPNVQFNGGCASDQSLDTVVSAAFPGVTDAGMFLFNMDLKGIAVSGGSACASGSLRGSHVISTLYPDTEYPVLRFSFGIENRPEDVDQAVEALQSILK